MMIAEAMFPAKFFAPNKSQLELIQAVGSLSDLGVLVYLLTSANGVGKSTGVGQILINIIYQNVNIFRDITSDLEPEKVIPSFFEGDLYNDYPAEWPKRAWFVSNAEAVKSSYQNHFADWLPQEREDLMPDYKLDYENSKDGKPYVSKVTWQNGWELEFKTVDQDVKTFESANVSVVILDEPVQETIFDAVISRLRMGGIVLMPATPIVGSDAGWFLHRIIESDELYNAATHKGIYWWATASAYENTAEEENGTWDLGPLGKHLIGNINRTFLDGQVKAWQNTDQLEARVYGRISGMSGRIIKNYNRDLHFVKPEFNYPPKTYMWRMVVDPHDRRPAFASWIRMGPDGQHTVMQEWPTVGDEESGDLIYSDLKTTNLTWGDQLDIWIQIEKDLNINQARIQRIIDPNYGNRRLGDVGILLHEYLSKEAAKRNHRMSFINNANNDIKAGHAALRELLSLNNFQVPGLVISDICNNIDISLRRYAWAEFTGKNAAERRGLSDKPAEKYKDPIDGLRYHAMVPWHYEEMPTEVPDTVKRDYRKPQVPAAYRPKGAY